MGKVFLSPEVLREKYNWIVWIIGESRNRVNGANYQLSEALKRMGIIVDEKIIMDPNVQLTHKFDSRYTEEKTTKEAEVVTNTQRLREVRQRIGSLYKDSGLNEDENDN